MQKQDYENYLQKAIGYDEYIKQMAEDLASNTDVKMKEYIKLNRQRMQRIEKTYELSPELGKQVKSLNHKVLWLVLTEHWCGDAGQTLPASHKIANMGDGKIEMKLIYRDQNPELINAFLTDGTRSIPKLIQLNEDLGVTGIWGPRPSAAQQLVNHLKSEAATLEKYANELHLWYAKDKQKSLETEISKLLIKTRPFAGAETAGN